MIVHWSIIIPTNKKALYHISSTHDFTVKQPEKKSVSQKSPRKKKDTKTNRRAQRRSIDSAIFSKLEKSQNPQVKEDLMMTTKPSTKHEEDFSVQETPSGRRRRHTFTFARNKI